jgi:hypothetical protein
MILPIKYNVLLDGQDPNAAELRISDSVMDQVIDGGYTLRQVMRIMLSVLAGDASGLEGASPTFRDIGDTKDRVIATYSSGTRTVTTIDVT